MRLVPPALAVLALLAATPGSALGSQPIRCLQPMTSSGPTGEPVHVVEDRGVLYLNRDVEGRAASYEYDRDGRPGGGGWTRRGDAITFLQGPLGGQATTRVATGYLPPDEARMPYDPVAGRTFPLVLTVEGEDAGTWYCGRAGFVPRQLLGARIARVERTAGFRVRLPRFMHPPLFPYDEGSGQDEDGFAAAVDIARPGAWRFEFGHRPCSRASCSTLGWVEARLLRGEKPFRWPPSFTLADGRPAYRNWPSCGLGSWGGAICGWEVLLWQRKGVEYAIQWPGSSEAERIRWANQMLRR